MKTLKYCVFLSALILSGQVLAEEVTETAPVEEAEAMESTEEMVEETAVVVEETAEAATEDVEEVIAEE